MSRMDIGSRRTLQLRILVASSQTNCAYIVGCCDDILMGDEAWLPLSLVLNFGVAEPRDIQFFTSLVRMII